MRIAMKLLKTEIDKVEALALSLEKQGLHARAECRQGEAQKLRKIFDHLQNSHRKWKAIFAQY